MTPSPAAPLSSPCPVLLRLLALMAIALSGGAAHAQYLINVTLSKKNYLPMEPVAATVSISNRSGADIVVGANRQSNWLSFQIEDSQGRSLTPVNVELEDTFIFQSGASLQKRILISDTYALSEVGSYAVKAVAFHPPTQQYYESNRVVMQVIDSKPYKEFTIGVPAGYPDAGRIKRYAMIVFHDTESTSLYARFIDDRTNTNLLTYLLGPIQMVIDPVFTVDSENRLHAFFLAAPRIYAHAIIKPDGRLDKRLYFREVDGSRPTLVSSGATVDVVGGVPYDPAAPAASAGPGKTMRRASERPPGL